MQKAKIPMLVASALTGLVSLIVLVMWAVYEIYAYTGGSRPFDAQIAGAKVLLAGLFIVCAALLAWYKARGAGLRDILCNLAVCVAVPFLAVAIFELYLLSTGQLVTG
jgi:hypothetical protein